MRWGLLSWLVVVAIVTFVARTAVVLATRRGYMVLDRRFWSMQIGIAVATLLMGVAMSFAESRMAPLVARLPRGQEVGLLALVGVVGSVVYVGTTFAFFRALGIRLGRR